jgi:hypothetical protein
MSDILLWRSRRRTGKIDSRNRSAATILRSNSLAIASYAGFGGNSSDGGAGSFLALNTGFNPGIVWTKCLSSSARSHRLNNQPQNWTMIIDPSNTINRVTTDSPELQAYANGYTFFSTPSYGANNFDYLSLAWRLDPSAGTAIVTWLGNGSTRVLTHNLGVAPTLIWVKNTSLSGAMAAYCASLDNASSNALFFNSSAPASSATYWNSTQPTTTQFSVGSTFSQSSRNYVAYLFAPVPGVFASGRYTGTNLSPGPIVNAGLTPNLVLLRSITTGDWFWFNRLRGGNRYLVANQTFSETISTPGSLAIEFQANGFQVGNHSSINSAQDYLWWAWA